MNSPSSSKMSGAHIMLVAAVIAGIAILLVIIMTSLKKPIGTFKTYNQGYADGFNKARAIAYETMPGTQQKNTSWLSGQVVRVSNEGVAFKASGLLLDPAVDNVPDTRIAQLGSDTKIVRITHISANEFSALLNAYNEQQKGKTDQKDAPKPPSDAKEEIISVGDIKVGDYITVHAEHDQNVLYKEKFLADVVSDGGSIGSASSGKSFAPFKGEDPVQNPTNLRD